MAKIETLELVGQPDMVPFTGTLQEAMDYVDRHFRVGEHVIVMRLDGTVLTRRISVSGARNPNGTHQPANKWVPDGDAF